MSDDQGTKVSRPIAARRSPKPRLPTTFFTAARQVATRSPCHEAQRHPGRARRDRGVHSRYLEVDLHL